MSVSDNDRIAYLSGERVTSLSAQERGELDELRDLLATPATWEEPDSALEDRVVSAIAHAAGPTDLSAQAAGPTDLSAQAGPSDLSAQAAGPSDPSASAVPPTRKPGLAHTLRERLRRRPALAFGAFAAAAAAVVAVIVGLSSGSSPARLQFAMVVSGTPLAPGAQGSATLTKTASGWQIQLSASGLPHLENGRYYQAWLKNASGILVPVGTFNDARHVTLWSGVPVTTFRTLTVTRQLANGNPASSGRRVLVGTISSPR